jgi:hypothetical protein
LIKTIVTALENIDWRYVTLSQFFYEESDMPMNLRDPHWLERPFAYEIYHQLRLLWKGEAFDAQCVIQAEVLKKYQQIRYINKMPDLLMHQPNSERNLAIVEIKLASNKKKSLMEDIDKLALFQRVLHYETLVEVIIGADEELKTVGHQLNNLDCSSGAKIDILLLSLNDHKIRHRTIKRTSGMGNQETSQR